MKSDNIRNILNSDNDLGAKVRDAILANTSANTAGIFAAVQYIKNGNNQLYPTLLYGTILSTEEPKIENDCIPCVRIPTQTNRYSERRYDKTNDRKGGIPISANSIVDVANSSEPILIKENTAYLFFEDDAFHVIAKGYPDIDMNGYRKANYGKTK